MNRIIINEQDLTSNVESLSSYDVAYVPGFATATTAVQELYRKPTLFTNKYTFAKAIAQTGNITNIPEFGFDQLYPLYTDNTQGFPTYAIPDGDVEHIPNQFQQTSDLLLYYHMTSASTTPFYITRVNGIFNVIEWPTDQASGYTDITVDAANKYVSSIDSSGNVTYAATGSGSKLTKASNAFYSTGVSTSVMFEAGEADPGYRYALYLLSLGIPVYYEVMNNTTSVSETYHINYQLTLVNKTLTVFNPAVQYYTVKTGVSNPDLTDITKFDAVPGFGTDSYITAFSSNTDYYTCARSEVAPISVTSMYKGLLHRFAETSSDFSFDTPGDYSIKFITSGGYPTFEYGEKVTDTSGTATVEMTLATAMVSLAQTRGDSIALIDHTNNPNRDVFPSTLGGAGTSVIDIVRTNWTNLDGADFAAMFTPWFECSHSAITLAGSADSEGYNAIMPGSLAYLSTLAVQLRDYNPWLAVAGVTRGKVPNISSLHTTQILSNNIADSYQTVPGEGISNISEISINPITYIRNVGYCIWGNRTLRNNGTGTTAMSFLNIRSVVSDIKKLIYETSQSTLFEQNTDVTWLNFKSNITPLLDRMVSNYILSDYAITRYLIDPESGERVPAYKVLAVIKIQPINSIEVFDLTIQLENTDVTVTEI